MTDQSRKLELHALGIKDDGEPVADFRTDKTHQMNSAMRELYEVQAHRQTEIIAGLQVDLDRTQADWYESDRRQKKTITRLHLALFAVGLFAAYLATR